MPDKCPIGVFDSGYGGLTVLKDIVSALPGYDYLYLGDNARAPYGSRSFETVYEYTLQAVKWLFSQGCELVILACNTASAKALRTIQQHDLPHLAPSKRVLGVIRPTSEVIGNLTSTKHLGILGTTGTIQSNSYQIEIEKFFPDIKIYQHSCPMWVPLIENNEYDNEGAAYFIKRDLNKLLSRSEDIDTILLACTHYPLVINQIQEIAGPSVRIISQGGIVARALSDYLMRHEEIRSKLSNNGHIAFFTTDDASSFSEQSSKFFGRNVTAVQVDIN